MSLHADLLKQAYHLATKEPRRPSQASLRREGVHIGRCRAGRLMRLMGRQAIYRAPRTRDRRRDACACRRPSLGHGAGAEEGFRGRRRRYDCLRQRWPGR